MLLLHFRALHLEENLNFSKSRGHIPLQCSHSPMQCGTAAALPVSSVDLKAIEDSTAEVGVDQHS